MSPYQSVHQLAKEGNLQHLMDEVLRNPSCIDLRDSEGKSPLHWAIIAGDQAIASWLLDQGAKSYAMDDFGNTPLHLAWHMDSVRLLLKQGVVPSATNIQGRLANDFQ